MGRGPEETFLQRGNADSQQTHEKTLNITDYQGNANQNHSATPPNIFQNHYHQKGNK